MEIIFIHFLKSSVFVLLFLSCYHFFLKKETFFKGNRWFLLVGLVVSLLLPFAVITKTIIIKSTSQSNRLLNEATFGTNEQDMNVFLGIWSLILLVYCIGVAFFGVRLIMQFIALKKLISTGKLFKEHIFYHVQTQRMISPFSFFKYIFYYQEAFSQKELKSVLEHEKVHAMGYHSLDILFIELVLVVLWFNPIIWLYRKAIKQNLEFLADAKCCSTEVNKKFYQYLLLKQVMNKKNLTISNPFYNSLIKKRIIMLNQNQSKKAKMLKMFFIVPAIVLAMFSFNTNTEYVVQNNSRSDKIEKQDNTIDLTINKDTSIEELEKIKKNFAKDGIDFKYTVAYNDNNEIIEISLQLDGENQDGKVFNGNYNTSSEKPIKPIVIAYNSNTDRVSFGTPIDRKLEIHSDDDLANNNVWINSSGTEKPKEIVIRTENGSRKIFIDGKEISEDELNKMNLDIVITPK